MRRIIAALCRIASKVCYFFGRRIHTPCDYCLPRIAPLCTEECQKACPRTKNYAPITYNMKSYQKIADEDINRRNQHALALACRIFCEIACPDEVTEMVCHYRNLKDGSCTKEDPWECWMAYLLSRASAEKICRVCGCTQDNACPGGCYWVEDDLCSSCFQNPKIQCAIRHSELPYLSIKKRRMPCRKI